MRGTILVNSQGSGGVRILGHTELVRILALHSLDTLKFSYFAAVVMIACNHRGGYFCPGHLMPGSGDVYRR